MNQCPTCGDRFERLGQHFAVGSCDRPELTARQRALVEYLILRGANVRHGNAKPRLEVFSTERARLELVAESLAWVANSPRCHLEATDPDSSDMWAFTTVPHPSLDYDGPTDVERLHPLTLRLMVVERAEFVGSLFGSLHVDLRGFDVSGDRFRTLLAREGLATVEYDGGGYATDSHTCRYHWHPDVVAVPHYDAVALLEGVGLSISDVAGALELG